MLLLGNHLMSQLDLVFGSRRRVKKVRIFRAWFSHGSGAVPARTFGEKAFHGGEVRKLFCDLFCVFKKP